VPSQPVLQCRQEALGIEIITEAVGLGTEMTIGAMMMTGMMMSIEIMAFTMVIMKVMTT